MTSFSLTGPFHVNCRYDVFCAWRKQLLSESFIISHHTPRIFSPEDLHATSLKAPIYLDNTLFDLSMISQNALCMTHWSISFMAVHNSKLCACMRVCCAGCFTFSFRFDSPICPFILAAHPKSLICGMKWRSWWILGSFHLLPFSLSMSLTKLSVNCWMNSSPISSSDHVKESLSNQHSRSIVNSNIWMYFGSMSFPILLSNCSQFWELNMNNNTTSKTPLISCAIFPVVLSSLAEASGKYPNEKYVLGISGSHCCLKTNPIILNWHSTSAKKSPVNTWCACFLFVRWHVPLLFYQSFPFSIVDWNLEVVE